MRAVIMGTKEQYRNMGLESCLFMKLQEYTRPLKHYEELELSLGGRFQFQNACFARSRGGYLFKKAYHLHC